MTIHLSPLRSFYLELLKKLDRGDFDAISEDLRDLRVEGSSENREALRRLVSARIAVFRGEAPENLDWLRFKSEGEPWLEAEALTVMGVHQFHLGKDLEGALLCAEAAEHFAAIGLYDREALSRYNAFIGRVNAGAIPDLYQQLNELQDLENFVRTQVEKDHPEILAMVLRQKSYLFQATGRIHAALELILEASKIFERVGPRSDFHLALLQASDILIEMEKPGRARGFSEQVIEPLEVRVEFPQAYIAWRLGGVAPKLENFEFVPPHWRKKWEKHLALPRPAEVVALAAPWRWRLSDSTLIEPLKGIQWELKASSLEGRLIRALQRDRQRKGFLIELLWPEQADAGQLDNRLHRLISRVNKKYGGLIGYDGQYYRLAYSLQIE